MFQHAVSLLKRPGTVSGETIMMSLPRGFRVLPTLTLLFSLGAAPVAMAQSATSSSASEAEGATSGLGTSHRFNTEAAASAHCPGDTIVWASRSSLTYSLSATSKHGFYACKAEADTAGFHAVP
jgi:hypothetical protein